MRTALLLSILAILGMAVLACFGASGRNNEHKFIGTIESIDTGCWADAVCSMKISGDTIVFGRGWSSETFGELIGFDQAKLGGEEYLGRRVEVFGKKGESGTSISGSRKYYIKLLE
jgi:hypothetical protein